MKFKKLCVLPLTLLLTGCLHVSWNSESHEQGLFSDGVPVNGSYSYKEYTNESFDLTGLTQKKIRMHTDITSMSLTTEEDVKSYISDTENVITSIENIKEVSKNINGLRIGDAKDIIFGEMTIKTTSNFKAVEILCQPYSATIEKLDETGLAVDQNVKLGVNELGFQTVSSVLNEGEVIESPLKYYFEEETNMLKLICGPQRAIIKEITFYI